RLLILGMRLNWGRCAQFQPFYGGWRLIAFVKVEFDLPHPDGIAIAQHVLGDAHVVDEGAIAAEVADMPVPVFEPDFGMVPRTERVFKLKLAIALSADTDGVGGFVQERTGADLRPRSHHQVG